jgi:hypothetical protein
MATNAADPKRPNLRLVDPEQPAHEDMRQWRGATEEVPMGREPGEGSESLDRYASGQAGAGTTAVPHGMDARARDELVKNMTSTRRSDQEAQGASSYPENSEPTPDERQELERVKRDKAA